MSNLVKIGQRIPEKIAIFNFDDRQQTGVLTTVMKPPHLVNDAEKAHRD